MTQTLEQLKARRDELQAQLQRVQAALIAEYGALDLTVYQARLIELGLFGEWNKLTAEIDRLTPKEKIVNHGYWRRKHETY